MMNLCGVEFEVRRWVFYHFQRESLEWGCNFWEEDQKFTILYKNCYLTACTNKEGP